MLIPNSSAADITDLQRADLFRDMTATELNTILAAGRRHRASVGEFLFHQGDPARYLYITLSGRVKLVQITHDGQQVLVRYIGPGETFAMLAVLQGARYPVAAQVVQDCVSFMWDGPTMKQLMAAYPQLERNALRIMAERVQEFQDRVRELATERVERRIARALLRLARQTGRRIEEGVLIDLPLSRQDLAEMAGTTLYTVSRTLKKWEEHGLVKSSRARVTITYPHGLVIIAEDLPPDTPPAVDEEPPFA